MVYRVAQNYHLQMFFFPEAIVSGKDDLLFESLHVQYSKFSVKQPLKNRQNKDLNDKW